MSDDKEKVIADLMKHPGISRAKAEKLYSQGFRSIEDILMGAVPGLDASSKKKMHDNLEKNDNAKEDTKAKEDMIKAGIEVSMEKYRSTADEMLVPAKDDDVHERVREIEKSILEGKVVEGEEIPDEKAKAISELCTMPGINRASAERLYKLGFRSLADLIQGTMGNDEEGQVLSVILSQQISGDEELTKLVGGDKKEELLSDLSSGEAAEASIKELMLIPGIDREKAIKLRKKGIFHIEDLLGKSLGDGGKKLSEGISKGVIEAAFDQDKAILETEKDKLEKMKAIVEAVKDTALKEAAEKEKVAVLNEAEELFKLIESKDAKPVQEGEFAEVTISTDKPDAKVEQKVEETSAATDGDGQVKHRSFFKRKAAPEPEAEPKPEEEETVETIVRTKEGKLVRVKRVLKRKVIKKIK